MNSPKKSKWISLKTLTIFIVLFLIIGQATIMVFADPASFFDTDLAQGEQRFRDVVDEANASAVYYSYEFSSPLSYPTCIEVPREGGGSPAYVRPTQNGSTLSFSDLNGGVYFYSWSVGVYSWAEVVNEGIKWEFFSDASCSTPMEVNSFSVYVNDWGTCCATGNYIPSGATADGTAIYTVFDGGSYGPATELLGNIYTTISSTTHIVAEIDDRSETFTEVTVAPNGDGEAFKMGGKIIFTTVPEDSVPPGSGSTPSIPPLAPDLIAASDLGISSADNLTADTTPTFTVEFTPQNDIDFVNLYADGVLIGTSGIAGTTSPTTVTITATTMLQGSYTITAKVENGYWHDESDPSQPLNITIDSTPPVPTITSPDISDGDTTNDASITVNFSSTETTSSFTVGDVVVTNGSLSGFSGSGTSYSATLTPSGDGEVIVQVPRDVYIDNAGNDNLVSNEFNWFSDQTPPTVAFNPKHGETIVANDGNIILTLSEEIRQAIDDADLNNTNIDTHITLRYDDGASESIPFDATIDLQNMVITVNPDSPLMSERDVYVSIGDSVEDMGGNALADSYAIFHTADENWPTLSGSDPADGDVDVLLDSNIVLYFSEPMNPQTGYIEIRRYDDNSLVEQIDVTSGQVTGGTTSTITIDPTNPFDSLTDYYILIDGTAFDDFDGNSYYGISDKDKLNFTTEYIDEDPPVPSFNPDDGDTDVPTTSTIVITFDEVIRNLDDSDIDSTNVDSLITLKDSNAGGSDIPFDAVIDSGDQIITITPSSALSSNQFVYVAISNVEDDSDNAMTTQSVTFQVEDISDPILTATVPVDNATGVAVDQNLILTFDEPVWPDYGTVKIYLVSDNSVFDSISVASATQISGSGTSQITINPSNTMDIGTAYYVQIDPTAFVDASGNRYAGIANTTDFNFTTGTNQAPIAADDSVSTDEATPITTGNLVAANDSDPNSDPLSVSGMNSTGTAGNVTNNGDGTFDYDPNGMFEHVSVGSTDTDTFTYTITDGNGAYDTATVTVTINGLNDPVTAVDDAVETDEDTAFTTANLVEANDTDVDDDDTLTVTSIDTTGTVGLVTNNGDGTFDYDPNGAFSAVDYGDSVTDTFTYTVSDGHGSTDTATVTVTINGVNHHPQAFNDAYSTDEASLLTTGNVLINDSDPDGDGISITSYDDSGMTGDLTSNGDNTYDYDPNGQFEYLAVSESTTETFTYTISDGLDGVDTATVTITVTGLNDPVTATDDNEITDQDTPITTGNVLTNDTDPDTSDTLIVDSINTTGTQGIVTDNGDGTFDYDPNGQFDSLAVGDVDLDTFTYTVSDQNGSTDTATVAITISGTNDAPDAVDDAYSTDENNSFTTGNVMANDVETDTGGSINVTSIDTTGTQGIVTDNGDGTFDYDPNGQFENLAVGDTDTDTFTYTITDDQSATDTATVTITINGINDIPDAVDDSDTTYEDTPVTVDVLTNDTDADDGTTLTIISVTQGTRGTVINNGTDVTYTPDANYFGSDTFTYTISDGDGGEDTATVTITVDPVDDIFVFGNSQQILNGDTTPSTLDDTDFGTTTIYTGVVEHTFTIQNPGTLDVNLTGDPRVEVNGTNPDDFTITVLPASPVLAGGGTTTFTVTFTPLDTGTRTAEISFINHLDTAAEPFVFTVQGEADATGDQDADGMDDELEGDGDRDGDGVPNYADYDPTGYFYNEATGQIVTGGLVEVTGPGTITLVEDGSLGYYQFFTDGTTGTYTITLTLPPRHTESVRCLALDPPALDPSSSPDDPLMLGNGEDGNSGLLISSDCTDFYYTFDLEADDPQIINNNFALHRIPDPVLPDTGFAPGQITIVPEQPLEKAYEDLGPLWLEIPTIGVQAEIVGVPVVDGEWDVTWLGDSTGYLNGTAFPTWEGNTVITGHVWDQFNHPSVFAYLRYLQPGDVVKIHAWGLVYTYEIESSMIYWPAEYYVITEELEGDWLTLFTCEGYSSTLDEYLYRRVVRAVLSSVDFE